MEMVEAYLPCCGKKVFVAPNDKMTLTCNECHRSWKITTNQNVESKHIDFRIVEVKDHKNKQMLMD